MFKIKGRQFEILLHLLKSKKSTYKELSSIFEVSTKTIERDINTLSNMSIPIYCSQGKGGGVYIDENYKLSTTFFTNEDMHNIVIALNILDSISTNAYKSTILKKLSLISPDLINLFESDSKEYIVTDLVSEKINIETDICKDINYCLDEELLLSLQYNNEELIVAPISYVIKNDGLYLYCYEKSYKLIKVNEIIKTEITADVFIRNFKPYDKNFLNPST